MNYQRFIVVIFSTVLVSLISCNSQKRVVSFTNDDAQFKNYETYNIVNYKKGDKEFSTDGAVFINQLENGITDEMNTRKYEKSNDPDILIRYEIISGVRVRSNNNYSSSPYNNSSIRNRNFYDPFYTPFNNSTKQIEGVLLIELKDHETKKLIWQGSLDLKYSKKNDNNRDILLNAINTIFNEYNYAAGSSKPLTKTEN